MNYTLVDVRKEFKKCINNGGEISKVTMSLEEFGEGYNLYCNAWMHDEQRNENIQSYIMSEETKLGEGTRKAMRIVDSLISSGYQDVKYIGVQGV